MYLDILSLVDTNFVDFVRFIIFFSNTGLMYGMVINKKQHSIIIKSCEQPLFIGSHRHFSGSEGLLRETVSLISL